MPSTSTSFPYTTLFRSPCGCLRPPVRWPPCLGLSVPGTGAASPRRGFGTRRPGRGGARWPDPGNGVPALGAQVLMARTWPAVRSEEHTSELQSLRHLVCRQLLLPFPTRRSSDLLADVFDRQCDGRLVWAFRFLGLAQHHPGAVLVRGAQVGAARDGLIQEMACLL